MVKARKFYGLEEILEGLVLSYYGFRVWDTTAQGGGGFGVL